MTENLTLTATWQADTYTLTFRTPLGSPVQSTMRVTYGQSVTLHDPVGIYYVHFAGWYHNGVRYESGVWEHVGDMTLTASFGSVQDDLPDTLHYDDVPVHILTWSDAEKPEFAVNEDLLENPRMQGIAYRNSTVQSRLGVRLEFDATAGNSVNTANFVNRVDAACKSGLYEFDLVATYSRTAGALAARSLLIDLNTIGQSYLSVNNTGDDQKPWWPKTLADDMSIGGRLYLLSGDISIGTIDKMHCLYFNKDLADIRLAQEASAAGASSGSALLYQLVRDGTWTVDKLVEYALGNFVDKGGNHTQDIGDIYGLCSVNYCATALYAGAGLRMLQNDPVRWLKLSKDAGSARAGQLVRKLSTLMTANDYFKGMTGSIQHYLTPFQRGESLFALQYQECAENFLVNNDAVPRYGVLPCPKGDAEQAEYYSAVGNACSVYGISRGCAPQNALQEHLTMLSAVLECWACESFTVCTPLVLRHAQTQDDVVMLEYVRAGIRFDLGGVLQNALGDKRPDALFIQACENGTMWGSVWPGIEAEGEQRLYSFVATMQSNMPAG